MKQLKDWLHINVKSMSQETIKSITGNHHYRNAYNATFNN